MANTNPLEYFICGGFGGICAVVIGHPLDTIKVRLQTMPKPAAGEKPMYTGTWDCISKTVKGEGIKGLYKGIAAPLVSVAPIFSISFFSYGIGKKLFGPKDGTEFKGYQYYCAGAFSALFTTTIMAPGERIKCLLQTQQSSDKKLYNDALDCAIKLYKQGGIRSIYLGSFATMLRDVPAGGAYFLTYETMKNNATENGRKDMSILETIAAGGMAGIANWIVAMPADVLKSRLQAAPEGTYKNGIREVFSTLIKTDGILGLYTGFIPVLLRAFPANAACFVGFEISRRFLNIIYSK